MNVIATPALQSEVIGDCGGAVFATGGSGKDLPLLIVSLLGTATVLRVESAAEQCEYRFK